MLKLGWGKGLGNKLIFNLPKNSIFFMEKQALKHCW
jgi:hypothetical protein